MSKWIDAEWIRNMYADFEHYENRDDWTTPIANVLAVIDDAPSIDIVSCKECNNYFYDKLNDAWFCRIHEYGEEYKPDDYCSYGERKESE